MTTQSVLLDFSIPEDRDLTQSQQIVEESLNQHLKTRNADFPCLQLELNITGGKGTVTRTYSGPDDLLVVLRVYPARRLLTLSLESPQLCPRPPWGLKAGEERERQPVIWSSQTDLLEFVSSLHRQLGAVSDLTNILPAITRGLHLSPYWTTTDDRIVECGITRIVHEEVSPYQKIQILDTIDFGRVLLLDGAVQLSEADDVYTTSLLADSQYDQADVLILGGGDGALLAHLVHHHQPRQVTMVELDGAVMRVVRDHMHSVTRGVLDSETTERYNIITGDALKHLSDCQKENKKYDFIFGDLTDVPIDTDHHSKELWDFISEILSLGLGCIKPGGRYLTHVSGKAVPASKETFRTTVMEISKKTGIEVNISFSEAFVPSFMESWVFAQITVLNTPA